MFKIFSVIFEGLVFWNSQKPGKLSFRLTCSSLLLLLVGCGEGGGSENSNTDIIGAGPGDQVGTGSGTATLSWEEPTTNADGTPLEDLSGFRVYYGKTSPLSKTNSQGSGVNNTTTYTLSNLEPGTYYFAVAAIDLNGNESNLSEEVSHVVQ